eukprot:746357-Prymnesium_polylepis.2
MCNDAMHLASRARRLDMDRDASAVASRLPLGSSDRHSCLCTLKTELISVLCLAPLRTACRVKALNPDVAFCSAQDH